MADGSVKPVEQVAVGAKVSGGHGQANRVVGMQRPRLGKRRLYALNGGRYFVTAEQPFMTPVGWKAIDREAAAQVADLKVGPLVLGDAFALRRATETAAVSGQLALAAAGDTGLVFEPLMRLRSCQADPATPLYDLLFDGNHTYFADGYIVHNNNGGDGANVAKVVFP